jgi:ribosome-binding factor A
MSQRTDRIDQLLREEIGSIVARDVSDPAVGFVTITDVETTQDLSHAQVWVSVIGQQAERDRTVAALARAMPFVRRELGSRLRIRRIPELHVRLDETAERGTRVLRLLHDLEAGGLVEPDAASGESLPTPVPRMRQEGDLLDEPPSAAPPPVLGPRRRRTGSRRTPPRGRTKR